MTKEEIYARIPGSRCSDSCYRCCTNIIQYSPSEEKAMGGYAWDGQCSHLADGKCSVYENRPFVCRIHGASVMMKCDDCICDDLLSEAETMELVHEYVSLKKREEAQARSAQESDTV